MLESECLFYRHLCSLLDKENKSVIFNIYFFLKYFCIQQSSLCRAKKEALKGGMMKKNSQFFILAIVFLLCLVLLSSCASKQKSIETQETIISEKTEKIQTAAIDAEKSIIANETDTKYISAEQAVKIAYEEIKKSGGDPYFSNLTIGTNYALHYDWLENAKALSWVIGYIFPDTNELKKVTIRNGSIDHVDTSHRSAFNASLEHPKDSFLCSMQAAISTVMENGGIQGFYPVNAGYSTGDRDREYPHWYFIYAVPIGYDEYEYHYYFVDAQKNELSQIRFADMASEPLERSELLIQETDLSGMSWMQDQRHTVLEFLALINEGLLEKAVGMMDDFAVPDNASKEMWIQNLSSIQGFELFWGLCYEENKENWTDDEQVFRIEIIIPDTCDCEQYGWSHGENIRWVILRKYDQMWKIHAISTSP